MITDSVIQFKEAINTSKSRLNALSEAGEKIIGYFCTYTPVEIIHAAGFIPVRITGGYGNIDKAYQHVPDFICPYMKLALEKALDGQYDFLSGLVQGYSCDAACGMVNVWKDTVGLKIFHSIPLPYNNTLESGNYFKSVLNELIQKLDTIGGNFSESALNGSMNLYCRIRTLLYNLYQQRYKGNSDFSAAELMTIIDAGSVVPPEDYLVMLEELSARLPDKGKEQSPGILVPEPVLVSGSLIERPEVMDMIEASGGRIVADDLCNGLRQILPVDGKGKTPMERLIHRYMNRFPCPSRSRAVDRGRRLLDILNQSHAKGVIFLVQKFCTPHLADIPILSESLKELDYPSILIEMDETWQMEGQIKTRLEGFFEMIGRR
ncbi:MAG: 2-hydroxyacyl-CoA dehydratase [Desulfobacteraceae bacterium]|nr:2-hydroxyacyl-CoA dehydratase [Desulfobacteraceae bacterium]MBC2754109.1 2-hydroxyacyl-CoA dehydratase [Desulfobacteraceae bacterium]